MFHDYEHDLLQHEDLLLLLGCGLPPELPHQIGHEVLEVEHRQPHSGAYLPPRTKWHHLDLLAPCGTSSLTMCGSRKCAGECVRRPSKITAFGSVAFSRSYPGMHRSSVPITSSISFFSFFCNTDCLTRFAMIHCRTVVVVSVPPLWNSEHKLTTSSLLSFLPSPSDNSRWRRV
ncbi:unnamed protein product [Musa acuminata subsp. malaccensis]|uniref:(wild Malaysian banana) hypothetical protein n=1 Tax=Musa acuminata subsp. malaccensis TaxID=214687 RepID=A0A804JLT5_MUSAM|nr:unnamed protein product [Musa acuminata subsp. malaccensis]